MRLRMTTVQAGIGALAWLIAVALAPGTSEALEGKFELLKKVPSTHSPGKVKLTEFADFYCPHCHLFEQSVIPLLKEEFGNKLEITMVGFPVISGKLPTPFEMYEQARAMGKGEEMKQVLFRTIHQERAHMFDRLIREMIVKEVGLDPEAFEAGLASGKPAQRVEEGKKLGHRVNVTHTPTIVLDGNIKPESIDPQNLKTIIRSILAQDEKR